MQWISQDKVFDNRFPRYFTIFFGSFLIKQPHKFAKIILILHNFVNQIWKSKKEKNCEQNLIGILYQNFTLHSCFVAPNLYILIALLILIDL